jgi:hypothetical protein
MGAQQIEQTSRPVKISWTDRLMDAVERGPLPYWVVYPALFFLETAILHLIGWQDGWVKPYTLERINFLYPLWAWVPLLAMTYLDGVAKQSLHAFAPLLEDSPEDLACLQAEFTHMPPGPVFATGLIWVGVYALMMVISFGTFVRDYGLGSFAAFVSILTGLVTFPFGGVLYYHTIHQLRLVSATVKRVEQFKLFQLDPVYAFSRLTARTGLVWLIMLFLTQLFFTTRLFSVATLSLYMVMVLLALAAFVLPIWSVHQRLEDEKRRLLAEANQRLEDKLQRLHHSLDADHLEEVATIHGAVGALVDEREVLSKIPTWPWRAGTLAGFVSALILPVILALIQIGLEKLIK